MFKHKRTPLRVLLGGAVFLLLFSTSVYIVAEVFVLPHPVVFGVTYSPPQARYLGLNERETFSRMLDDLQVKYVRLPVYWNEVQSAPDWLYWDDLDYFMAEASKRGVNITLVLGQKVPRWPECHIPVWALAEQGTPKYSDDLNAFLKLVVNRYQDSPALYRYQVENEPLFPFGKCPSPDLALLNQEIDTVRSSDPSHPVQLTVSGEQEAWLDLAHSADVLGVSLYRVVWNSAIGPVVYPHPPSWYGIQRLLVLPWVKTVIISELQAEPWFDGGVIPTDLEKAYQAFPKERLRDHVAFARRTGFHEAYLWGVEWWYYLEKMGDARLLNEARRIFRSQPL
ncbi:MAG: hypothetical protein WC802_00215 [Patescibacteria group bacterium]|jgi:hypothetical protein